MILLFKLIILTVIIVLALRVALSEGMLLEKLGGYFERKVDEGNRFFDIFVCPWCSGTLQSLTAHAFAFGLGILPFEWNWQLLIRWPLVVFASSFISGVLWTVYLTLNQIKENNMAQAEYYQFINRRD
jgi:hypothetical protein